jgi:hypothetical protein
MPIEIDPQQISVAPSGRYIREFKTDLPRPTLNLNPLAEGIGQVGGEMLTTQAKITGREAGLNAVVEKDQNGNYNPPPPPETFGETARLAYNHAIEQTYTNSVYRDTERVLNEIANKPNTPPEQRIQLMQSHIDATLNSVDPKYKGQLNIIFGREFNQRQASILNQARSEDTAYRTHALAGDAKNSVNSAVDAWSAGDFEAGNAHIAEARKSYEIGAKLKTTDENLIADQMRKFDEQTNGFRWFNETYQKVRAAVANKTADPEEINRLVSMLQEGATGKGATAFGMTDTDIVKNMSRESRIHMRQIVNTLGTNYSAEFAQSNEERKAQELHDYLTNGGKSKPDMYSDKDLANAARKAADAGGFNLFSKDGVERIASQFNNVLPHEMYKSYFAGIHENDAGTPEGAKRVQEKLALYNALRNLHTNTGVEDRTEVIGTTERNYLHAMEDRLQARYGLQEADRAVKAAFKYAGGLDQKSLTEVSHKAFREDSGTQGPIDPKDVVMGAIKTITSFRFFESPSYGELPKTARDQIEQSIAMSVAQGVNYKQAAKDAGRDFINNWTKSSEVIAGLTGGTTWIQKKDDLPTAYDALTGKGTRDYLIPYVNKILAERLNDGQKAMLGELKYGDNIKLEPTSNSGTNRSYYVTYYKTGGEGLGFSRLMDKDGQPLLIYPQGAKDRFEKYTAAENEYRTVTDRSPNGSNVPDITFASTPKPKDTNQKVALIAAGTNDYGLPVGTKMDTAVGNNIKEMIDLARSRGQQPVIVMPNGEDPKFANVRDSIQRAVNDIGADKVTVIEGKYDKNDPAHLSNASMIEISSKYRGAVVYGDSNAVRLGNRFGYKSETVNGLQTIVDATGKPTAQVSAGTAAIFQIMKNHPVPVGSLVNPDPINKPELKIDLRDVDPLPSTKELLGRIKAQPLVTEDKKKLLDAIGFKIDEYNLGNHTPYILKTIGIESQMNPKAKNPESSAYGLGQFTDEGWATYGRGDRKDPIAQIDAFMRFTQNNIKAFERKFDRKATNGELYIMHQQGTKGGIELLSRPDENAMSVLQRIGVGREKAVNSIYLNVPTEARAYAGSMTARQFTSMWMNRFN